MADPYSEFLDRTRWSGPAGFHIHSARPITADQMTTALTGLAPIGMAAETGPLLSTLLSKNPIIEERLGVPEKDFIEDVLNSYSKGKPGLSIEPLFLSTPEMKEFAAVYRDPRGIPIAVAETMMQNGRRVITNLAASKSSGILSARAAFEAAKHAVQEIGAEPPTEMSSSAYRMFEKSLKRLFGRTTK